MCSIHTMVTPDCLMSWIKATSSRHSASVRPPAISSSSRSCGPLAKARASSSRLRPSKLSVPARRLAKGSKPVRWRMSPQASTTCASRCWRPWMAATRRFSNTVRFSNGRGIWNERPMPPMQRARGGVRVMSLPSKCTVPVSGRSTPVMRLNSVDLPAPFGPMMPSASPRATSSATPSTALSEPNDRARLSSLRITSRPSRTSDQTQTIFGVSRAQRSTIVMRCRTGTLCAPSLLRFRICDASLPRCIASGQRVLNESRTSGDRLHLAADRYFRRGFFVGDDDVVFIAVSQPPLAADQRGLGDIFLRKRRQVLAVPGDVADHGVELGRGDRFHDILVVADIARTLGDIDRKLEQRVDEADRLRPLLAGRFLVGHGDLFGRLSGQRRLERMVRRPPDFRRQVVAVLAQSLDGDREQDRFADRSGLRLEALLLRLIPEGGEIGRQHHAGDDLAFAFLEGGDLGTEIVGQVLIAARIGELVAELLEYRRKADLLVAPGVAVAVIGKQASDRFVGLQLSPHIGEHRDHVFESPEEVIGVVERFPRRRSAARIGPPAYL